MARRKTIPQSIDTPYFEAVTPMWQPPSALPIPERYRDAVIALAEWAGPNWADSEKTGFFRIRQVVIDSCESWNNHDWTADAAWIEERRTDSEIAVRSSRLVKLFSKLIGENRFRRIKIRFCQILLANLDLKPPPELRNYQCINAVDKALIYFQKALQIGDNFGAKYGAIEYASLPSKLPRPTVAIALCLADRITFFRKDGNAQGTLFNPHKPNLSPALPWRAISLFASAHVEHPDEVLDPFNIQTLVESLSKNVAYVSWTPDKRHN